MAKKKLTKAELLGDVIDMINGGFDYHIRNKKKQSKKEILESIEWFSSWLKGIQETKNKVLKGK